MAEQVWFDDPQSTGEARPGNPREPDGRRRRPIDMRRLTKNTTALAVLVVLGVSACSSGGANDSSLGSLDDPDNQFVADSVSPAIDSESTRDESGEAPVANESTAGSVAPSAPLNLDGYGRAIAVEAGVVIGTPNIRQAVDDALVVVRQNNGSVYNADVNIGDVLEDGSVNGSGRLTVKVPPRDLDALIADLDQTAGTLLGRTQSSDDVTEQLIDIDIRLRVERTTIEQFEVLLAEASTFSDIVTIQQVITEHTIVVEQLLATQRNIEQRVELSTLTIDLLYVAPGAVAEEPVINEDDGITDAFRSGWDVFAGIMFALGFVLAVATPFIIVAAIVLSIIWLFDRRRRARARRAAGLDHLPIPSPADSSEAADQTDDNAPTGPRS